MGDLMDKYEAARALNVADADVVSVESTGLAALVKLRDGATRLITPGGHFAADDHPATAHLRRVPESWFSEPEGGAPDEPDEPEDKPEPKPRAPRARKPAK